MQPMTARRLPSMFFARGHSMEYVRNGSAFRRVRDDRVVETAKIDQVYLDTAGIPHVRFDVTFTHPHRGTHKDGPRVLSLKTFFDTFPTRT
jgi:hypothetical protein